MFRWGPGHMPVYVSDVSRCFDPIELSVFFLRGRRFFMATSVVSLPCTVYSYGSDLHVVVIAGLYIGKCLVQSTRRQGDEPTVIALMRNHAKHR